MATLPRCTPETVGVSSRAILSFLDAAKSANGVELHSLMLLKHGKVLFEGYWNPYRAEHPHTMYSFSKTLTATAIGLAQAEGLLSVGDRLCGFFEDLMPENPSDFLRQITVKDLLTMSCGHGREPPAQENDDFVRNFLAHPMTYAPGTEFIYNTCGTNMLAATLKKVTGMSLIEYLKPRLFDPLCMSGDIRCNSAGGGVQMGGGGFYLRTEDMARLMQLYLQCGVWEGTRILPEQWVKDASSAQVPTSGGVFVGRPDWALGYGYQIWRCQPNGSYRADGAYGQLGIVLPEQDAVVITTQGSNDAQASMDLLWTHLIPALSGEAFIPEEDRGMLKRRQSELALPAVYEAERFPCEKRIDRQVYFFGENQSTFTPALQAVLWPSANKGIRSIRFSFDADGATLELWENGARSNVRLGMCGHWHESVITDGKNCYRTAGTAAWKGDHVLEALIRHLETAHSLRCTFTFEGEKVVFEKEETYPMPISTVDRLEGCLERRI